MSAARPLNGVGLAFSLREAAAVRYRSGAGVPDGMVLVSVVAMDRLRSVALAASDALVALDTALLEMQERAAVQEERANIAEARN